MEVIVNVVNKVLGQFWISSIAIFLCLIPTWIWLVAWYVTTPDGFWQKMLLVGIGLWLLGAIQFFLIIALAAALLLIWFD
jgi:hypothetical protein